MGRRKRQAEKRGCPCSLRFFVVHNGKRGKRKTRDITLDDNGIESRELYYKSSRTRLAIYQLTRLFQSAINENTGCIICPLTRFSGKLFLAQFDFCSWFNTPRSRYMYMYRFFLAPTKKTRHGYNGLFIIWDLRVTLVPDWQR